MLKIPLSGLFMQFHELEGISVFIIDDNPNNLNLIKDHLVQYGVKSIPLKSGESALSLLDKIKPDIILLDVQMSDGIDGFETCRRIKSDYRNHDIPVIFISAISEAVNKVTGFNAGGVDYITKPVNVEELLSRIYVHYTISRLQRELEESNKSLEDKISERTGELVSSNRLLQEKIAELEKTERELDHLQSYLSNIIDSMPSMLVGVDMNYLVTQWNRTAAEDTGIPATEALGKPLIGLLPFIEEEADALRDSVRSKKVRQMVKKGFTDVNTAFYKDINIYPLITNGTEGAVIRVDDVTDRIRMEEAMIQSEKMLSIGGLAAGMAHEINNPLAGILQTAEVMANRLGKRMDTPANIKAAEESGTTIENIKAFMDKRGIFRMIQTINDSGRRVVKIIDNMLGFAKKSKSIMASHSVSEILDNSVELASMDYNIKRKYDFKLIRITREYEDNLPPVLCERAKMQQVFLNILQNGAQAMHNYRKGDSCFILRISYEKEVEKIRIEIEDNGPGMDEMTRARIFEPFYTTKEPGTGTGLGLSVSYFIITENHGGELSVESRPGAGARFIIRLPLKQA